MVMKGCQKRIIVMKNTGSNLFDEAYFILKDSAVRSPSISEQDMVGEDVYKRQVLYSMQTPSPAGTPNLRITSVLLAKSVSKSPETRQKCGILSLIAFSPVFAAIRQSFTAANLSLIHI